MLARTLKSVALNCLVTAVLLRGWVVTIDRPVHGTSNKQTLPTKTTARWFRSDRGAIVACNCIELSQENQDRRPEQTCAPLALFRSVPAYLPLGDPGSGKRTAFEVEAEAAGDSGESALPH